MRIRVDMRELQDLQKFTREFPSRLNKNTTRSNQKFMEQLRDAAKARAPVDTGELKENIKLEPVRRGRNVKVWKLVSNSPHALFQEVGFTPHYATILNSSKLPQGRYFVSKFTPHIEPALQAMIETLDNRISNSIAKSIKQRR
jgi:hypothetical protein